MVSVWNYVITCVSLYIVFGICWYGVDRKLGVRVYRWWYNMTHKDPLSAGIEKGFIYNQPARNRMLWAWIASTVQSAIAVYQGEVNLLVEFLMWNVEVPVTLIGFMIAPYFYRLWGKRDRVFETIDKLEQGEIQVNVGIKGKTRSFQERARGKVQGIFSVIRYASGILPFMKSKKVDIVPVAEDTKFVQKQDAEKEAEERKKESKETLRAYIEKHK